MAPQKQDRPFNEFEGHQVSLRHDRVSADVAAGCFIGDGRLRGRRWRVIVEHDADDKLLAVVTAYRAGLESNLVKRQYLEVTFLNGKALAAYLHLPRPSGAKAARSDAREHGLVVDFTADGTPFGVEITAPALVELSALNDLLHELQVREIEPADLAPLRAT